MEAFKASFLNEIDKMLKKKKAIVIGITSLIVILLGQLTVIGLRYGWGLRGTSSTEFPLLVLSVFSNTILPLFTALVAIDIFAGEFSHNTMKVTLLRPVTRLKVFTSKIAATAFFVLINLFVVMILSSLTGLIFNAVSITGQGLLRIIISYLVTLLPIMTLALVVVFFSNILKSGVGIFFLTVLVFIVCKILGIVFSSYSSLFITSSLDWYNLWIADKIPWFKILRQLLIMLGYSIMFFTASFYLFDQRDL